MGPKESKPVSNEEEEQPKISHARFANRKFSKGANDEQQIQISVAVPNEKQFNSWKDNLGKTQRLDSLLLPKSYEFKKAGYCGNSGSADIIYESFPFLLSDQITNRDCLNKKLFEENQLWYLVFTLLNAGNAFHSRGIKVGDVRPDNIFISQDGSVRVANQFSWPSEQDNYYKTFFEKETTYLAPQEIKQIQFGKSQSGVNFQVAQTFSIGLSCLDAATLTSSKSLYQVIQKFQFQKLEGKLQQLQQIGYSPILTGLIQNMCSTDQGNRLKCRDLYQWLLPYQENINNFQVFHPETVPEKLVQNRGPALRPQYPLQQQPQNISSFPPSFNPYGTNLNPAFYDNKVVYDPNRVNLPLGSDPKHPAIQLPSQYSRFNFPPSSVSYSQPAQFQGQQNPIVTPINYTFGQNVPLSQPTSNSAEGSGYVPFNGKLSLDKIDEQLSLSRKMFPS